MYEAWTGLLAPSARRFLALGAAVLVLAGCAGSLAPGIQRLPERVELNGAASFRGEAYQSGPVVLASMLAQQGVAVTPGLLEKPLKLPGAEADLQRNMLGLAREYGMLVYPLEPQLAALLAQVAAGYPVMLRLNHGLVWGEPRYAVLAGYNRTKRTVLLRVGMNRHQLLGFDSFVSAWKDAGSWAVLIQAPNQLPVDVDAARWLQAADQLAQAGQEQAASQARKALAGH